MTKRTCFDPECDRDAVCRGMCSKHYQRWRKHPEDFNLSAEEMRKHPRYIDRAGERYGRLLVIGPAETRRVRKGGRVKSQIHWPCRCDCGNRTTVWTLDLKRGHTKSCGCLVTDFKVGPTVGARNRVRRGYRRNAHARGLCWELADDDFDRLTSQPCYYCGREPGQTVVQKGSTFTYNGIDRKDNSLGYILSNVVPCCKICNNAKRDLPYDEFAAWIARLIEYHARKAS